MEVPLDRLGPAGVRAQPRQRLEEVALEYAEEGFTRVDAEIELAVRLGEPIP